MQYIQMCCGFCDYKMDLHHLINLVWLGFIIFVRSGRYGKVVFCESKLSLQLLLDKLSAKTKELFKVLVSSYQKQSVIITSVDEVI